MEASWTIIALLVVPTTISSKITPIPYSILAATLTKSQHQGCLETHSPSTPPTAYLRTKETHSSMECHPKLPIRWQNLRQLTKFHHLCKIGLHNSVTKYLLKTQWVYLARSLHQKISQQVYSLPLLRLAMNEKP